ncbi:MAG: MsnO8 family LLM class oxidoreductase [Candidatus Latescibacteria bacterium]|nr:MsnO8 family LLM class oxidoreductase [Candidatus Latescibacterota bacterium]
MIPFSILDLAPIRQGGDAAQAFAAMRDQARRAEELGYHRYWLAEHHNMDSIASAATSVLIGHVASVTQHMRIGSGGVMLPNHAPLVIAEHFGTLESLYPGRIDLGLGRAPGTDPMTARALRRERQGSDQDFPQDVLELQAYFQEAVPNQGVRAIPGGGLKVPIWLLGSSLFSAQLAAMLGLPYAFASHFAPDQLIHALRMYRDGFRPSEQLEKPYAMVGINVVAADSDEEARRLFTSQQIQSLNMMRGQREPLGPPVDDIEDYWTPGEKPAVEHKLAFSCVGGPESVQKKLVDIIEQTGADELITTVRIFEPAACLRSLEILAQVRAQLAETDVLAEGG